MDEIDQVDYFSQNRLEEKKQRNSLRPPAEERKGTNMNGLVEVKNGTASTSDQYDFIGKDGGFDEPPPEPGLKKSKTYFNEIMKVPFPKICLSGDYLFRIMN